jgi:hypothetical protein
LSEARTVFAQLGRSAPRECGLVFEMDRRHCEERFVRRSSTSDRVRRSSQSEGGRRKRRSNPFFVCAAQWIASRSLSSGARSRDLLTRNDGSHGGGTLLQPHSQPSSPPRKRGIQYAAAFRLERWSPEYWSPAFAGDDGPGSTRSSVLTIFWHCGFTHFSSRTGLGAMARQQTVNGFGRESGSKGSGNADSQRKLRSSGWNGRCRPHPGDSGCVAAHPAYRRAASYLPLRAGWAVCAWALRGCIEITRPFRAQTAAHH